MNNQNQQQVLPNEFTGHEVNGESVVPGAHYLLHALRENIEFKHNGLRDIEFPNLGLAETFSSLVLTENQQQNIEVKFEQSSEPFLRAKLNHSKVNKRAISPWSEENWQLAEKSYRRLSKNGNSFNFGYRIVSFTPDGTDSCVVGHGRDALSETELLDGCLHSLLVIKADSLNTAMMLNSIGEIWLADKALIGPLYVKFEKVIQSNTTLGATLKVYADSGELVCQVKNLLFTVVDNKAAQIINVGGSFTLRPIVEAFNALTANSALQVGVKLHEYTPWQQFLLDPSVTASNSLHNILILRPEDVIVRSLLSKPTDKLLTHVMPNGMQVAHVNVYETDYLYKEIFIDRCYARNGVVIEDNDVVIDVGANIGMFSLYAINQAKNVTVHAFEPSPKVAQCIVENVEGRGNVTVHQAGVSGHDGQARFTFYPKTSVFSGFFTDNEADTLAVRNVIYNQVKRITNSDDEGFLQNLTEQMLQDRLEKEEYDCQLIGLSAFIKKQNIEHIGLLKIDAEKAELGILQAMTNEDFAKIRQICLEVHDEQGDNLKQAISILEKQGFNVLVEVEQELSNTGLFTVTAKRIDHVAKPSNKQQHQLYGIELDLDTFEQAVQSYALQNKVPLSVVLAATQQHTGIDQAIKNKLNSLSVLPAVRIVTPEQVRSRYPDLLEFNNSVSAEALLHFSKSWYAATASTCVEHLATSQAQPHKVIVVDADNTLWHGIVGEQGVEGIEVRAANKGLQAQLLKQKEQGVLLAICSKNIEKDVLDALESHPDMLVSSKDFITSRINWQSKSANVLEIAEELSLGLDSFVFIDDNAAECAEVTVQHPQLLCLQFPIDNESAMTFVDNHWVFTKTLHSEFDTKRHQLYVDQRQREQALKGCATYLDFIKQLQLNINISPLQEEQWERVSQLTERTNQFNANKHYYSVQALSNIHQQGLKCLTLTAADKFGDYGLVGVVFYRIEDNLCILDNILMSCRALNKGIEHQLLSTIAHQVHLNNCGVMQLNWQVTERNLPLRNFFQSIAGELIDQGGVNQVKVNTGSLLDLTFEHQSKIQHQNVADTNSVLSSIADTGLSLHDLDALYLNSSNLSKVIEKAWPEFDSTEVLIKEASELEQTLAKIWMAILGVAPNSLDDEFTKLGGQSLALVRMLELIYQKLGVKLSLFDGFKHKTLRALALKVESELQNIKPAPEQVPDHKTDLPEISPILQGLYFSSLLNPTTNAYNVPLCLKINGHVKSNIMQQAVEQIIAKSPVLSRGYKQVGRSTKAVDVNTGLAVKHQDIGEWDSFEVEQYLQQARQTTIDIKNGPLVHLHVLSGQEHSYVLILLHHMSCDLKSMELILSQLKQALEGKALEVDLGNEAQFVERLAAVDQALVKDAITYWQARLTGITPLSLSVTDNSERQSLQGAGITLSLSTADTALLKSKIVQTEQSAFIFLLAAYFKFLHIHCKDEHIAVGTPVSLRSENEQSLIGNYVNQIPIVQKIQDDMTWQQILEATATEVYCSLQYREIPFVSLVQELSKQAPSGRGNLVQTTFALHQAEIPDSNIEFAFGRGSVSPSFSLGSYQAEVVGEIQQCGQVDIAVECFELANRFNFNIKYDCQLLTEEKALQFGHSFTTFLTLL